LINDVAREVVQVRGRRPGAITAVAAVPAIITAAPKRARQVRGTVTQQTRNSAHHAGVVPEAVGIRR
jgi:hypothetical protein